MRSISKIRMVEDVGQHNKQRQWQWQMLDRRQQVAAASTEFRGLNKLLVVAQTQIISITISSICPRNSTKLQQLVPLLLLLNLSISVVAKQQQNQIQNQPYQYQHQHQHQEEEEDEQQQQQLKLQHQIPPDATQWRIREEYEPPSNAALTNNRDGNIEPEQQLLQVLAARIDNSNGNYNNRLPWIGALETRQFGATQPDLARSYSQNNAGRLFGKARLPRQSSLDGKQRDHFGALSMSSSTIKPEQKGGETFKPLTESGDERKIETTETPTTTTTSTSRMDDLDSRLSRFIKSNLVSKRDFDSTTNSVELKRSEDVFNELSKVYRVLKFVSKVADKIGGASRSGNQAIDDADNKGSSILMRSWSSLSPTIDERAPKLREPLALASAAASGISETVKRQSGKMIFGRLAKKTDWNALFVKLAKVFLQYFLDLILNDMFGTTGKF